MFSEPSETSKMEFFAKNIWVYFDYFCKTVLVICFTNTKYDKTKQNPGVLLFISQKIRTAISANLFLNSILSWHY